MSQVTGTSSDPNGIGVEGDSTGAAGIGVKGTSATGDAVLGISKSNQHAGLSGVNDSGGFGVWARGTPAGHFEGNIEGTAGFKVSGIDANMHKPGAMFIYLDMSINRPVLINWQGHPLSLGAALGVIGPSVFEGDVEVRGGDVKLTNGSDCAEEFDLAVGENAEPGTVMVIDEDGSLKQSQLPYDKCVAGVIAGAGECKPAITLGRQESKKVDAQYAPIKVGDLLTTSPTPGHAMKATDPLQAFGAVIGKALGCLDHGKGLIPILIALQ
jgi:hypothetical protein